VAELRARTERLHAFESPEEVEGVLHRLAHREEPLTRRLDRQPGQKESRWVQLLEDDPYIPVATSRDAPARAESSGLPDRVGALEERVTALEQQVARLLGALGETG
jgi:uncharacterized protein YceH (UPF0502 family)